MSPALDQDRIKRTLPFTCLHKLSASFATSFCAFPLIFRYVFTISALICTSGCTRCAPPCVEICDDWKNSPCEVCVEDPLPIFWWTIFNDPCLDNLQCQALEANPTLEGTVARMNQAIAQAHVQYAALFPNIVLNPSLYHAGTRIPTFFSFDSAAPTFGIPTRTRVQETLYSFPFSASYDADLWGQNWMSYQASKALAQASFHQVRQAWLMLTSEVAMAYYQVRTADKQLEILHRTLKSREEALFLQEERFKKGLVPYIQVAQAKVETADVRTQQDEQRRLRGIAENYLAALIGKPACSFCIPYSPLEGQPPCVPLAVPAEVLAQRPDLAAAERQLAAANEQIGVAETAFLPAVTLTGQLGYFSSIFNQLFEWESRFWSYGIQIAQIIFDAGGTQANVDAAVAAYMETVAGYKEVVLRAFKEVEDALVDLKASKDKTAHLQEAVHDARTLYKLTDERYRKGLSNYLDVVDAERTLLREEQSQAGALSDQYRATVELIQAMGGTW